MMGGMSSAFGGLGTFGRRSSRTPSTPLDLRPRFMGQPVDSLPAILPEVKRGRRRRITVVGEEVLHEPCREVTDFGSKELRELINDMFATNAVAHGAGLAANQIGVDLRVFVYDCPDSNKVRHVGHICNPVIVDVGERAGVQDGWEGCLSVPGGGAELSRDFFAAVEGFDQRGNPLRIEGDGLFGRCLQHETDHLNGLLYLDHLTSRARRGALREMEAEKEGVWADWDANAEELGK